MGSMGVYRKVTATAVDNGNKDYHIIIFLYDQYTGDSCYKYEYVQRPLWNKKLSQRGWGMMSVDDAVVVWFGPLNFEC